MVWRLGLIVLSVLAVAPAAQAETVYFLVVKGSSSYILPLTDPCDIADARSIIDMGVPKIVVAYIAPWEEADININRNYMYLGLVPSWSWYVTEFTAFADYAPEYCDGTCEMVEEGVLEGNVICFFHYRLALEFPLDPCFVLDPWCYVLEPDCAVDYNDLEVLASNWLGSECEYPGWCGGADLDVSGEVDFIDFALLAERWLLDN